MDSANGDADAPERAERVEQVLSQGFPALFFPKALETDFLWACEPGRRRLVIEAGLAAVVLFVGMTLSDLLLTPETLWLALSLRVLVFAPLILIGLWVIHRVRHPLVSEWGTALGGMLAVALTALILLSADGTWALSRVVELNIIVVYTCTLARFWPAVALGVFTVAVHATLVHVLPDATGILGVNTSLLLAAILVFTLHGNYTLERDERTAYLLAQRERALEDALRASHGQLARMAITDALTDVANRRHAEAHLTERWAHAQQRRLAMAVIMVDIDHFKRYNDHHGHQAGDRCLQAVARVLSACSRRAGDLVARLGGEEFVLVMNDIDVASAVRVAQRLQEGVHALSLPHPASPGEPVVTVSVGVACAWPRAGQSWALLMKHADDALYAAKAAGRNRVCVMDSDGEVRCQLPDSEGAA